MRSIYFATLLLLSAPALAQTQADVQQAAKSVYRIWLGVPLPNGFLKQTDSSHIQALQTQKFAEQVPLKGMTLRQKKSGKSTPLSGKGILFQYAGRNYLLIATGSAYAVSNKGHLVTNARFADNTGASEVAFVDESGLRDMGENGGQAQAFVITQAANTTQFDIQPAKQIVRDVKSDLAVLHADKLPTTALKLADSQFAKPADLVYALGVEGTDNTLLGKHDAIDRVDYWAATASEGKLDKRINQKNVGMWQHSAAFSGSVSGGALVNQCGQVLGTNQITPSTKQPSAIDAGELLPMLRKHNIPFEQYQGRCGGVVAKAENIADGAERVVKAAQHNPRGWLTVLGLAIATLIASVLAWKMLRWVLRQRAQTRHSSPPPKPAPAQTVAPVQPVQAAASPATTRHIAAPRTEWESNGSLVLQAVSGSLKHIALPFNRAMVVGRSADCDVVLSHPKVSAKHAKLWLEQGVLWVEDLNSTNGTFINNTAIRSPSPLKLGDVLQFTGDSSVASFRLPENPATPPTQLHQAPFAAVLQASDADLPRIHIPLGGSVSVGRGSDNDVVIDLQQVSRKHCRISADAHGAIVLEDLGSTNGTFVDNLNNRISQTPLQIGQTVYLADKNVAYRVQAA